MAPILSTAVGVTPQIIDDPKLCLLIQSLNEFQPDRPLRPIQPDTPEEVLAPFNIADLIAVIEPYQTWKFEEQVRQCTTAMHVPSFFVGAVMTQLSLFIHRRWICTSGFTV